MNRPIVATTDRHSVQNYSPLNETNIDKDSGERIKH